MTKDRRLYARFDIGFDEHDKIFPLSNAAFRALVEMTLYARRQLTDGFLADRMAVKRWGKKVIEELTTNDPERPSLVAVEGGWWVHDFAEHQTTSADIAAKREHGAKGAAKRWGDKTDSESVVPAMAPAMGNPLPNDGGTLAKTETETETVKTPAPAVLVTESDFSEVWTHWPKKVERKAALDQFRRAVKNVPFDDLKAFVIEFGDAYAATTEKRFVPALDVWLRGERWTDELPTVPGARPTSTINPLDEWKYR